MVDTIKLEGLELLGDGRQFQEELCAMIEQAPMFSSLSHPEVEKLSAYLRGYRAKKGATIFKEGGKGMFMCIVVTGRVDIFKETPEHGKKKVATVRPGKSMGEMSLLDDLPHSASSVAHEDTTLLMLTRMNYEKLTDEQPILCNRLLTQIARLMSLRLRQTTGILLDYIDH